MYQYMKIRLVWIPFLGTNGQLKILVEAVSKLFLVSLWPSSSRFSEMES